MPRVPIPIDKRQWHPSLIPGPIMLVSTIDSRGTANIAPKSWVQMVSFEPPILMFSGTSRGQTERNIDQTGCFALNVVDASLVRRTVECVRWHGAERTERSGFVLGPATAIRAPIVEDCKASIECRLHSTHAVGSALVVYGEIVAATARDDIVSVDVLDRYARLAQSPYLEDGRYSVVAGSFPSEPTAATPDEFRRYVYLLSHVRPEAFTPDLVRAHVEHLKGLEARGMLDLCGPFSDYKGGMVVVRASSRDEARAIAESDPFVASGAESFELRTLDISSAANAHMGAG